MYKSIRVSRSVCGTSVVMPRMLVVPLMLKGYFLYLFSIYIFHKLIFFCFYMESACSGARTNLHVLEHVQMEQRTQI